ncbi:MAG TPA: tyrosine-type recombinase/integrase [Spirochaetales bacterium]|jgi:integrase|nr:tyrosine-type recombinase/integrase [Spirochaetales bacterium]
MGRRQAFSIQIRNGIYYVQLWNEATGKYTSARSTEAKNKDEARDIAREWVKNGVPASRSSTAKRQVRDVLTIDAVITVIRSPCFLETDAQAILNALKERGFIESAYTSSSSSAELLSTFMRRAWSPEGPYVQERRAYRHSIGMRHIQAAESAIRTHWEPAFEGKRLGDIHRIDLKEFTISLARAGLAPKTVNKVLSFGTSVLRWAANNGLIPEDPTKGVSRFANIQVKNRGVLEATELEALVRLAPLDWIVKPTNGRFNPPEERERTAFLIAASTGMRLGEIVALRAGDLDGDRIHVRHSWSEADRLKAPKNGLARDVPLLPDVKDAITRLLETNPHSKGEESFVFWGRYADRPVDSKLISYGFNRALKAIGIHEETRKARGLSFHSLRHGYARAMSDRLATEVAMTATGHLSTEMLRHYSEHKSEEAFAQVKSATAEAFAKVLKFKSA